MELFLIKNTHRHTVWRDDVKSEGMFGSSATGRHATVWLTTKPWRPFCPPRKTLLRGVAACDAN